MAELSIKQKKDWAETLYKSSDITQKEIAIKVGVNEKTIGKWVKDNNWENLRKSLLTTKSEILRNLYDLLDKISKKLKEEESIGDSKMADMYVKYTAAIKNLETETSTAEIMQVARIFINWLQNIDPPLALVVLNHFDAFIKESLKRL